jgi:phosphoglycerate dehydrogenase-like enzyme
MNRPKVVIPDDFPQVMAPSHAYGELQERASVVCFASLPDSDADLAARVADAGFVINIRASSKFTDYVFRQAVHLRLLSIWGAGTDNVDLAAAKRHGVTVTNTPGVAARAVAEHALALLLAAARRIPQVDAAMRRGEWLRGEALLLAGKTLGIIGLGAVGREFARLGAAVGMRVVAWTPHPKPELGFELVSLDELLARADVVSLHLRLSPETQGLIGIRQLGLMKRSAILINTARGAITDEIALIEALSSRRIAAAGLDVFETEPLPQGHPLTRLDNVVLTPHSAGIAPEVVEAGLELAVRNIWSFLAGKPANVVVGSAP